LPDARGTVIRCDGEGCGVESVTGQIVLQQHRWWLREYAGWSRGQVRATQHGSGTIGHDLCPTCAVRDRAQAERRSKHTIAAVRARRQREGVQP
jgi:hypothetical protein